jgi:RNA polymerase sigma-70 factor (ECF subfamily)
VARIEKQRLGELIAAHGAALVLYARQWCAAPDDALQESLIELVRQDPAPVHVVGWLYKAVRRRAMNLSRSEQRRRKHHRQAAEGADQWFVADESQLEDAVDCQRLLRQLPPLEREIVVARIWGELSFSQIADLVGRSSSAVHRRYQNALVNLHKLMNEQNQTKRTENATGPIVAE